MGEVLKKEGKGKADPRARSSKSEVLRCWKKRKDCEKTRDPKEKAGGRSTNTESFQKKINAAT